MQKPLRSLIVALHFKILSGIFISSLAAVAPSKEALSQPKSIHEVQISLDIRDVTIDYALHSIEEKTPFSFVYVGDEIATYAEDRIVSLAVDGSVARALEDLGKQAALAFMQRDNQIVVKRPSSSFKPPENQVAKTPLQGRMVTGKVTDEEGEPLPGVNVIVKGTTKGTITDAAGNFAIEVGEEDRLAFSYVGFRTFETDIAGRSVIDVSMLLDITNLAEVIVSTGYWQTSEKLNPGNIAKVDAKVIERQPVANPLQTIQGRMAGVNVIQQTGLPGGGFTVEVRGRNNVRGPNFNAPFYVIDGVPFVSTAISSPGVFGLLEGNVNPLSGINPFDIESIEVLKDADATAIYGSRGANGVVLITTKKGRTGKLTLDVDQRNLGSVSWGDLLRYYSFAVALEVLKI